MPEERIENAFESQVTFWSGRQSRKRLRTGEQRRTAKVVKHLIPCEPEVTGQAEASSPLVAKGWTRQDASATGHGWHAETVCRAAHCCLPLACRVLATPTRLPNLARSREKVLHGVVGFRHRWVPMAPASEKAREAQAARCGGGRRGRVTSSSGSLCTQKSQAARTSVDGSAPGAAAHSTAMSKNPESFPTRKPFALVAAWLRSDPRASGDGPGLRYVRTRERWADRFVDCRWRAGHKVDRPHPSRLHARSIASRKTGRSTFQETKVVLLRVTASANAIAASHNP